MTAKLVRGLSSLARPFRLAIVMALLTLTMTASDARACCWGGGWGYGGYYRGPVVYGGYYRPVVYRGYYAPRYYSGWGVGYGVGRGWGVGYRGWGW